VTERDIALERLVDRFMRRAEIKVLGLTREEVKAALIAHARQWGGCVNCLYSTPNPRGRFSWVARGCVLGLRQDTCGMRRPIVEARESREPFPRDEAQEEEGEKKGGEA